MSFPAYPDYKNSGVEWANELPAHWKTVALKWVSRIYAGGTPDKSKPYYWENGSIPWLNSGAVNQVLISEPSSYITIEAFNSSSASWIPAGSLVIALAGQGKTKGMVAQLAIKTTCNQSMAAIVPDLPVVSRYLFWWLSSNYQNIRNMAGGDLRDGLNLELIGNIAALMPTEAEQTQIARFLDHETARIDALIEEQQRLIELLKEKRQAVISHAVTKGLDPTVPMKDSGVEWLGEVPAHWVVRRIKHLTEVISKGTTPTTIGEDFQDEGIRFLKAENIFGGRVLADPEFFISERAHAALARSALAENDVLVVIAGATTGKSAVLSGDLLPANTNQAVSFIRLRDTRLSEFIQCWLSTDAVQRSISLNSVQSAQPNLSMEDLGEIPVPLPPLDEIDLITDQMATQISIFDGLISEAVNASGLLQERRSALISAAVTGKIDVRGWQPPASTQAPESAVAEAN